MSMTEQRLFDLAHQLGRELKARKLKIVLAESCTAGVLSMALSDLPGISENFCGSAVTYRNETKAGWLSVSRDYLANPRIGPVSPHVAEQMCLGALEHTPEADLAASVTGHLGPDAPPEQDGVIYIAIAFQGEASATVQRRTLADAEPPTHSLRFSRQREAALLVVQAALQMLASRPPSIPAE
jgi:PncC family amidohydrolase